MARQLHSTVTDDGTEQTTRCTTLIVGLERMAVGGFVVTMQLYGHHVLEVPDSTVSGYFSAFLVTFATVSETVSSALSV